MQGCVCDEFNRGELHPEWAPFMFARQYMQALVDFDHRAGKR